MPLVHIEASAVVAAAPGTVYGIISDYREAHPRILPPRSFRYLVAEAGGIGAGTRIRYEMITFGRTRTFRAAITEPEPGRILVETDLDGGPVTTFEVSPEGEGRAARVTIVTEWETPGLQGWIEKLIAPPALRRVFAEELRLLEQVAAQREARRP